MEGFEIGNSKKKVRVGSQLPLELKETLVAFLQCNEDVFACSQEDMLGVDLSMIVHRLNVDPSHRRQSRKEEVSPQTRIRRLQLKWRSYYKQASSGR